ncbi:LPXTG cell wall anchor domain-containing protein [Staphylococcus hominis]|uniref:LPXTG cell wall anchor domain-containing protein n=1 Tax=Staphylococcus hominis TaxID=1290 RepID=UPI00119D704E|nr:LPXTG cell wall anchor domain-containing protein [Staphylococcus hominis]MBF2306513.1 LPXTG cell wall anchor domain-containing protein [Staphylococcus hominis]MBF2315414.1 LPXTG cell wall anchor domain-containing protein [Staphylococcus hominis]MBF2320524.1 LPXTG cell wall anchor domain-containing protein [Staphylococcus hominis]MCD8790343.1 LPXTG cell wall anchor domain-containing protein [Staphylococcus hominis]
MKKSKVLATTTLAGALLFTGVGATHHANAAESEVTANNATDIGISVMKEYGQHPENVNFNTPEDRGDHYVIFYGNKSGHGSGAVEVYKNGLVKSGAGALAGTEKGDMTNIGYYQFEKAQDSTTTNNASGNISNEQQNQTANKQVSSQGNQSQYSSTTKENNTQSTQSNEAQALPETGEESNSGLVTIVASVLLATGSLLAFRRTSNSK